MICLRQEIDFSDPTPSSYVSISEAIRAWNGKLLVWDWLYIIANLEMFSFVLLKLNFAEWTAIAEYIIWNPALVPALILQFVLAGDMLDLLKWRTHPDKIAGCLSKLKEIDGSEIVKVYTTISFLPLFCF